MVRKEKKIDHLLSFLKSAVFNAFYTEDFVCFDFCTDDTYRSV